MDDKCKCWDLDSADCVWEVNCDSGITSLKAYEDFVYIGMSSGCLLILDTNSGNELSRCNYFDKTITYID